MKRANSTEDTIDGLLAGMSRELRCSVCLFNFKEAATTPCGHTFCNECIVQHLVHKTSCPLCNQELTKDELHPAYSVQEIVKEFQKMRDEFERERNVNLSQLPIQYLSHQDTVEQDTPRSPVKVIDNEDLSMRVIDSEGPLSNAREHSPGDRYVKVYLGNDLAEIDVPNMSFTNEINEDTTHVVLKAEDPNFRDIVKLSDHYLLGILHGCYIVDYTWLEKCKEMNSVYPETRFEIAGETKFGRTGAPAKSRKNKMEGKRQKLFRGTRTKFITDDEMSRRYERYIRIGGGTIVSHGEIIVCDQDMDSVDTDELHEQYPDSKLLFKGWIDECICAYELVQKDKYTL